MTAHPLRPTSASHSSSRASWAKWASWVWTSAPWARSAVAMVSLPSERSMKRGGRAGLGRFERELAAERFLDVKGGPPVVLREFLHRLPGLEALGQDRGHDARPGEYRSAEGDKGIDHHRPRLLRLSLARERIQADGQALRISFDAPKIRGDDFSHGELTRLAEIDQQAGPLDEEIACSTSAL